MTDWLPGRSMEQWVSDDAASKEWLPGPGWLFCPANRPERYVKALGRADVVILDLEDAVAPVCKDDARQALVDLATQGQLDIERTVIRVNGADSPQYAADLAAVATAGVRRLMLPKAEDPGQVASLDAEVIALIETPRGVERAGAIAEPDNVVAMMWGADDLVAGLGGTSSRRSDGCYRDVARYARQRVLVAAKSCCRLAVDAVFMDISDLDGLARECEDAAATGYDATVAIHPSQVPIVRRAYLPDPARVDWARRLLDTVDESGGVTTFEGRMVDGPVFKQARRTLQLAHRAGTGNTR